MKPKIADLLDKLVAHGSLEQIAHQLEVEGLQGECGKPGLCVIAEYLKREGVLDPTVYPGFSRGVAWVHGNDGDECRFGVVLPPVLNELAVKFDANVYPNLVTKGNPR